MCEHPILRSVERFNQARPILYQKISKAEIDFEKKRIELLGTEERLKNAEKKLEGMTKQLAQLLKEEAGP